MGAARSRKPSLVFSLQNNFLAEHSRFSAFNLWRLVVSLPLDFPGSVVENLWKAVQTCYHCHCFRFGKNMNQRTAFSLIPTPTPTLRVIPPSWFFYWQLPAEYKTPSSVRADVTQKLIKESFLASLTRKGGWPSDAKQDHSLWSATRALLGKTLTIPPLHQLLRNFPELLKRGCSENQSSLHPAVPLQGARNHQSPQDKLLGVLSRNNCLVIPKYSFQQLRKRLSQSLNTHAPVTRLTERDNWVMNKVTLPSAFPPANIKREWVLSPPPLPTSFSRPPTLCLHWSPNLEIWHPLL